jgi:hypothetical protein
MVCRLHADIPVTFRLIIVLHHPHVILKIHKSCISMRDIVCQYRGTLIPLLKNWAIFSTDNNHQSTRSSDRNGNDDSDDKDNENKGNSVGGSCAVVASAA